MTREDTTCWNLITGASEGRSRDREEFSRKYLPMAKAYFAARWRRPTTHVDVDDASQEVIMHCLKPRGALSSIDPDRRNGFRAYFFGIASNVAAMTERARRQRREVQVDSGFLVRCASDSELSAELDKAFVRILLEEAFHLLQRSTEAEGAESHLAETLKLRFREDLPAREISLRQRRNVKNVYRDVERGKAHFRSALLRVMGTYHPLDSEAELSARCIALLGNL